jgi:hypothetical protein
MAAAALTSISIATSSLTALVVDPGVTFPAGSKASAGSASKPHRHWRIRPGTSRSHDGHVHEGTLADECVVIVSQPTGGGSRSLIGRTWEDLSSGEL